MDGKCYKNCIHGHGSPKETEAVTLVLNILESQTEMVYDGMIGTVPSTVGLVIQKGSKRTGAIITIIFLNVSTTC